MREVPSEFQAPLWPQLSRSIPFNHFVIKLYSAELPWKMINQHQLNTMEVFYSSQKRTLMMVKKSWLDGVLNKLLPQWNM